MKTTLLFFFTFLFCSFFSLSVLAEEEAGDDITLYGLEVEKLLNFGSGILALVLSLVTWSAYRRTQNKRLQYVSLAFFLFAIKGFLLSHELFFGELPLLDPITSVLDFVILLAFFIGIIKK